MTTDQPPHALDWVTVAAGGGYLRIPLNQREWTLLSIERCYGERLLSGRGELEGAHLCFLTKRELGSAPTTYSVSLDYTAID